MNLTPEIIENCRAQFPALSRTQNEQTVIYFDGPAGTQVPRRVGDAIIRYLYERNANHGGHFATSRESDQLLHEAHSIHADFLNAEDGDEIAFGQNMTSLTFAFSRALSRTWSAGDEIIVTALDHDANISPWVLAAQESGVNVHFAPYREDDFLLDLDALAGLLNEKTKLVAVGCASNATGGINPVKQIAQMAHDVGALVFLDAVHYGPHGLIDVKDWDCDFLVCSHYKFFGPHLGLLWGRRHLMEQIKAFKVRPADDAIPSKWMTGTQSHESIAGGSACIEYLADLGRIVSAKKTLQRRPALESAFNAIVEYEQTLANGLLDCFESIADLEIFGVTDRQNMSRRFPTFSIRHPTISPSNLAQQLGDNGIFVWHGNYYAYEFSHRMGFEPEGMVRIGAVHYNTIDEIDRLQHVLDSVVGPTKVRV